MNFLKSKKEIQIIIKKNGDGNIAHGIQIGKLLNLEDGQTYKVSLKGKSVKERTIQAQIIDVQNWKLVVNEDGNKSEDCGVRLGTTFGDLSSFTFTVPSGYSDTITAPDWSRGFKEKFVLNLSRVSS